MSEQQSQSKYPVEDEALQQYLITEAWRILQGQMSQLVQDRRANGLEDPRSVFVGAVAAAVNLCMSNGMDDEQVLKEFQKTLDLLVPQVRAAKVAASLRAAETPLGQA